VSSYKIYWDAGIAGGPMLLFNAAYTGGLSAFIPECTAGTSYSI
jgi:hypothetical protein